jgi:hypothetical protein
MGVSPSAAGRPKAQPAGPQRGPAWHAIQLKAAARSAAAASGPAPGSGLPGSLKAGVEQLSGIAMDDVHVHRNSSEPAKVGALAFAQGTDIHLGPGQEAHLPHEAWHVVQQKQGRVRATTQLKSGASVNDDRGLEQEADEMAQRLSRGAGAGEAATPVLTARPPSGESVCQRKSFPLPDGYALSNDMRTIFLNADTANAKYWKKAVAQTAANRADLLTAIAGEAATIGAATRNAVRGVNREGKTVEHWTPARVLISEQDNVNYTPVRASISGSYTVPPAQPNAQPTVKTLEVDYHFGSVWAGYVVRVHDSAGGGAKSMVTGKPADPSTQYSNEHDDHKKAFLAAQDKDADATTKVVGEGARWQAVARNAGKLRDDSTMFTNDIPGEEFGMDVRGIFFRNLTLTWVGAFGKKYGIPDTDIVEQLQNKTIPKTEGGEVNVGQWNAAGRDMNMDICVDNPPAKVKNDLEERSALIVHHQTEVDFDKEFSPQAEAVTAKFSQSLEPFGAIGYGKGGTFSFGAVTKVPPNMLPKELKTSNKRFSYPVYRATAKAGPAKQKVTSPTAGDENFRAERAQLLQVDEPAPQPAPVLIPQPAPAKKKTAKKKK